MYRVRIDELGADFGGEVPRAEGGRGEVNLPPFKGLAGRGRAARVCTFGPERPF